MNKINNPFTIISPEDLTADTAHQLFVEVYSDFPQVKNPGHSMIIGARGSGKSMIFRCLLPDVLKLTENCKVEDLEFIAFHIPIKNTTLKITELQALEKHHASNMINEHFFVLNLMMQITTALTKMCVEDITFESESFSNLVKRFHRRLKLQGCNKTCENETENAASVFQSMYELFEDMHYEFVQYLIGLNDHECETAYRYDLPILSFQGFVVPFLQSLREVPVFNNKNIYLLIDDADNLSKTQTQILNSWLSCRTAPSVCLKISTQIGNYKSFVTTNGTLVEAPHDYQEINISEKYTTSKSNYYNRIHKIVEKRLNLAGITNVSPEEFFPTYEPQETAIETEKKRLLETWEISGRGNRPIDDAQRYARPNYIRDLGGTRKQRSSYMYAGFETLVHLSSGIVRLFLDSAAAMYDEELKGKKAERIESISHTTQNKIAREKADEFLYSQFRRLEIDDSPLSGNLNKTQKLQNLIFSMGKTFHDILVSDRSERRVFSIALSNIPTPEMMSVFELGVQTGYLHRSYIGTKDGAGRTWLFVLNRYISPVFVLDPTSFAGYLFVTNDCIENAMNTGARIKQITNTDEESLQLSLFDEEDYDE